MKNKIDKELQELIKEGTQLLKMIHQLDELIATADPTVNKLSLEKARNEAQSQFNIIFDKVFDKK